MNNEIKECKYEKHTFGFVLCGEFEYQTHCCDIKDCYYKQLLAEQDKCKKLVEALELIMNNDDEPSFENYTATQALLANEVNK